MSTWAYSQVSLNRIVAMGLVVSKASDAAVSGKNAFHSQT